MSRLRYVAVFSVLTAFIVATAFAQDKKDPPKDTKKAEETKKVEAKKEDAKKTEPPKKEETKKTEPPKKEETKKTEPPKKEEAKKEETKKETPKAEGPALAWKFTVNKPIYQSMSTTTEQTIKVMGLDVVQKQEQTFYFKFTPLSVDKDGVKWEIKQEIEGIQMKIDIAGNPVSYDSTQEAPSGGTNTALSDFFKGLKEAAFTVTFNTKTQKVEKVAGREKFLEKLATANPQLRGLLEKILSEDALKQMADPTFGILPPAGKKVGETWESTSTLNLGPLGTYVNKFTYTLKGPDPMNKDQVIITFTTALTYTAPTEADGSLPFKIKSSTLQTKDKQEPGKIVFDTTKGRLVSSESKLALSGTLTIDIGGNSTQVELTQTQETKVKCDDKSLLPAPPKK